ncbi:hypothetical protein AVEN_223102-1 [Araneus ventricosus]|uniref:Acid-sensing ion channel 1 n=1 Tax=Araneus ventricosus TaxID=182803 RepID=A0A4Y2ECE3_ARAVE|nr:hypothetical protein AVEN_223102-1 [Araneus ventricosus]
MSKKKEVELEELAKQFAANKVSAAGVSNIVLSRSGARRCFWFIAVMSCITFMGYMTVKVILEYLSYPKVLIIEDEILPKLPFPAVTLCSLNPISSYYVKYTSIKKVWDLKEAQKNFTAETKDKGQSKIFEENIESERESSTPSPKNMEGFFVISEGSCVTAGLSDLRTRIAVGLVFPDMLINVWEEFAYHPDVCRTKNGCRKNSLNIADSFHVSFMNVNQS